MEVAYNNLDGYVFRLLPALLLAIIVLYMIFIIGSSFHQYATGRMDGGTLVFVWVRIFVVLVMTTFIGAWIGFGPGVPEFVEF